MKIGQVISGIFFIRKEQKLYKIDLILYYLDT